MKPDHISTFDWFKYNALFLAEHFLGKKLYGGLFSHYEKKFISSLEQNLDNHPKGSNKSLFCEFKEKVDIKSIRSTSQVQVFRGAAKDWECSKWNLDYFKNEYGEQEVTVLNSDGLFEKGVQEFGSTSMSKYIDMLKKGSKVYLKFSPMVHHDSELRKSFDIDWLENFSFPGSFGRKFFLFIGGGKTLTPIHTALSNTVFIQIYGKKKWTFWAPNERLFLNVRAQRRAYFFSGMNAVGENGPEYPLSKYCHKFEVTLEPGDVLWFPGFFWHHVVNEIDSVGVAYKTAHLPSAMKNSLVLTMLSFLSTKPFLLASLFKTRFKNNERVFLD